MMTLREYFLSTQCSTALSSPLVYYLIVYVVYSSSTMQARRPSEISRVERYLCGLSLKQHVPGKRKVEHWVNEMTNLDVSIDRRDIFILEMTHR
jgi:hypothetical protein